MASFGFDTRPAAAAGAGAGAAREGALSILSRGLREDLRLIRARAGELETFLNAPVPEPELFARLRRAYTSSASSARTRLDLSAIGKAFEAEVGRGTRARWRWEEEAEEWEPIRMVKARLRELERRRQDQTSDVLHKVKLSLKSMSFVPEASEEVPPLDLGELFAYFLKQSEPLFDQLGIKRDVCNKLVESLCSKRKDHLGYNLLPTSEPSSFRNDSVGDELDLRIASVLQSTGHHYEGGFWNDGQKYEAADKRHVAIVTTASLPWMTGTAVNPLFRAAYLTKSCKQDVTLVVPWLCKSDQELVYPNSMTFSSPQEQEAYMRNWLEERVGFKTDFKISFYPGKFQKERRSIIPAGDTSQFIPSKEADIAILEEPEHLNWYHHGKRWTDKFNHVVGVVHTNYLEYIKREKNGAIQAFFVKHINNLVARAYCHKVLRLSGATQDLPKSIICNVHGVNPKFLEVGERIAAERASGQQSFSKGAYFLGKMVWAKGYRELIDLFAKHKGDLEGFKLDIYGNGEDSHEVQSAAKMLDLNLNFHKGRDHADDSLHGYKVFINPSISDVLCTATAEALAMGKFVVCADHPSNDFFRSFPNCLTYKTSEDFFAKVKEAMTSDPQPRTPEQRYDLSWEAATQRFMEHSELDKILSNNSDCASTTGCARSIDKRIKKSASVPNMSDVVDGGLALVHYCFTGNELLRLSTGALAGTLNYNKQHSLDLHLLPPQVQNPIYGCFCVPRSFPCFYDHVEYIKREKHGAIQAFFVKHINNLVARAYCHKVLRLSGATQDLPKSIICNVHGVNPKFLEVGERIAAERASGQQSFSKGAYFLGKMVWAKGYRELIDLFAKHKGDLEGFKLDIYGNGEDSHEVQSAAKMLDLNLNFHKGRDHADDSLHGYKVFINPSISDVLCTATAEALAMGKFVVCADHPSNDFFRSFPNCLTYKTSEDFFAKVKEAMTRDPQPLTPEQRYDLSWEAATQRFMEHSELDKILSNNSDCASTTGCAKSIDKKIKKSASVPNMSDVVDGGLAFAHYCFTGNELLRLSTGAIPGTLNYNKQHSLDLHLLPPQVQNPIYGW